MISIRCYVCGSSCTPYFSKTFQYPELGLVHYVKCTSCKTVYSAEHVQMPEERWQRLNAYYHGGYQGTAANLDDPRWQDRMGIQAELIDDLASTGALPAVRPWLDFACGDGRLAQAITAKGHRVRNFDRFMGGDRAGYMQEDGLELAGFDLVINTSMFEHVRELGTLDEMANLVSPTGVLAVHTLVCEDVPADPAWFYLLPVHCSFFTNRSMQLLFQRWGFASSLYHVEGRMWFYFRHPLAALPARVHQWIAAGRLHAKDGFMDYWK